MINTLLQYDEVHNNLSNLNPINWDGSIIEVNKKKEISLFFVSLYCVSCIDFLPHIKDIKNEFSLDLILFTNGNDEDHKEMAEYFDWDFPIVALDETRMQTLFNINKMPATILLKSRKAVSGVVENKKQFQKLYKMVGY